MTPEQYDRWKDFAIRMARTCFKRRRRPDAKWIVKEVEYVFSMIDEEDIPVLESWDSGNEYLEGHPYYRRQDYWLCQVQYGRPCQDPDCDNGKHWRYAQSQPFCDFMSDREDSFRDESAIWMMTDAQWKRYRHLRDREKADELKDAIVEQFYDPVRMCIRAGLDMASAPSAGVAGFTAGDIRRMYPEGVPDWLFGDQPLEMQEFVGKIPGVGLVPGQTTPGPCFADLPDDAGVWL